MNSVPSTVLRTTMDESITIRVASVDDIEAIISLGIRTFRDTFDEVNTAENMMLYLNSTFTQRRIAEEITEPGSTFFLAEQDSEIIGYARVRQTEKPDGVGDGKAIEIERLYADKKFLGKRVGYLLMSECLQYARDNNADWVWLGVWEHNDRAIGFYKRWGFEKFSDHVFMLGNDAQTDWLMKKRMS
jgi:diamine N-acetyltransferase